MDETDIGKLYKFIGEPISNGNLFPAIYINGNRGRIQLDDIIMLIDKQKIPRSIGHYYKILFNNLIVELSFVEYKFNNIFKEVKA